MGNERNMIVDFAISQIGYCENPKGSNRQKYGAMLDKLPWYLRKEGGKEWIHKVNGYDWCTQFVDASYISVFTLDTARKLLCRPVVNDYGSVVKYAFDYFKKAGRGFRKEEHNPQPGDVIYFQNSDGLCHTGIVKYVTDTEVTTIEGNAGSGNNYVVEKTYKKDSSYIYGYGVPAYSEKYPACPFKAVNTLKGVAVRDIPYSDGNIIATIKQGAIINVEALEGSSGDFAKITGYVYLPGGFTWEGQQHDD